ncbi:hypothetical protein SLA2020_505120 [Shorea laevis]
MLAHREEDPNGDYFKKHLARNLDYIGVAGVGMKMESFGSLKCCLLMSTLPQEIVGEKLETKRLYDAVNVVLSLQSKNGGLSAWEPAGASRWLEMLNPTEFFEEIVIEHEYVECTSSAIQTLILFKKLYPQLRKKEIESCIANAVRYLEKCTNTCWVMGYSSPVFF